MTESRTYKEALLALNSLQSNAQAIRAWIIERRNNLTIDLKAQMMNEVNSLGIDLESFSIIHVAGTKGKGSVCAFTESILRACGYTTGLYTSPHLVSVTERIRVNGLPISQERFTRTFWIIWDKIQNSRTIEFPRMPSYFRFLTLLAFVVFLEAKVDVIILEVGVGGRTDATNIFDHPVVCGIASIGYDHMNVLGNTLTEIAFTIPQTEEAMESLQKTSNSIRGEPLVVVTPSTFGIEKLKLGLEGEHQYYNAALAIALSKTWLERAKNQKMEWNGLPEYFIQGLQSCYWPGRSQKIAYSESILFHLDGAHTSESMEACSKWWNSLSHEGRLRILIFNCHQSRDPKKLLPLWVKQAETFDAVIFCPNESGVVRILEDRREDKLPSLEWQEKLASVWEDLLKGRNLPSSTFEDLKKRIFVIESFPLVINKIEKLSQQKRTQADVLVTGSLFLVGTSLEILKPEMCDQFPPYEPLDPYQILSIFALFFGFYVYQILKRSSV